MTIWFSHYLSKFFDHRLLFRVDFTKTTSSAVYVNGSLGSLQGFISPFKVIYCLGGLCNQWFLLVTTHLMFVIEGSAQSLGFYFAFTQFYDLSLKYSYQLLSYLIVFLNVSLYFHKLGRLYTYTFIFTLYVDNVYLLNGNICRLKSCTPNMVWLPKKKSYNAKRKYLEVTTIFSVYTSS